MTTSRRSPTRWRYCAISTARAAAPFALSPSRERRFARTDFERLTDITSRAIVVCLFSMMAVRFGADFLKTGRVTGLLLLGTSFAWISVSPTCAASHS